MTSPDDPRAAGPSGERSRGSFRDDILAQPRNLQRAAATFLPALGRAELGRFRAEPIVFTGMGASLFAAVPAALILRAAGRLALAPDAGISVLTYTASLLAGVALTSALLAGELQVDARSLAGAVTELVERADAVAGKVAGRLGDARAVDVVGQKLATGSAGYGALLIREAARIPAASFDTHQYLHGPLEVAEAGMGAVLFGSGREVGLARHLASAGATVLLVAGSDVHAPDAVEVVGLPDLPPPLRPILEAVPVQLLADHLARARGLVPGSFRHHQDDTKVEPR